MKKYEYVVASGCSFTAEEGNQNYSSLIANHFGAKFYNLARSGGTVYHVNRTILEWCGKNKDKFNDTLIILGMPQLDRVTLWSNKDRVWQNVNVSCPIFNYRDKSYLESLFHFFDKEYRINYIKNFWNENVQFRYAINIIVGLQSFFKVNNIDHLFFDASANPPYDTYCEECCDVESFGEEYSNKLLWDSLIEIENWYKHPEYSSFALFTMDNIDMRQSKTDIHPNKKGHKYWSECLIEYINEKNKSI
jgi:hypothetical protein